MILPARFYQGELNQLRLENYPEWEKKVNEYFNKQIRQ